MNLTAGGSATSYTEGLNGTTQTGYATAAINAGAAPYGTAVFSSLPMAAGIPLPSAKASITITAFQSDGVTGIGTSQGPLRISASGYSAFFADQFIASLPAGFTGVLDITSSTPFAALTVRSLTNKRGDSLLATFPIADMTLAAFSPIVFPRIADGGGYVTQFILIGAGGASSVTLNYYGEDGKPLPVGKFLLGSQNALGDALKNLASVAYPHLVFPGCLYLALADRPVYEPAKMSNTKFPGRAIASDVLRTMSNYPAGFGFPTDREFRCQKKENLTFHVSWDLSPTLLETLYCF